MYHSLLLAPALLLMCTPSGEPKASVPPQNPHGPVKVLAGTSAVLPCEFNVATSPGFPTTVEWSKIAPGLGIIFLYRDGRETLEARHPAFGDRASFAENTDAALRNGTVSLKITSVPLSDTGTYRCRKLWKDSPMEDTEVELRVAAFSEPRLSVVRGDGPGVMVQCEVEYCLLEPSIVLLDDGGHEFLAEDEPRRGTAAGGCDAVTRRAAVQRAPNSVTCSVQEPESKQSRDAKIYVADCQASSSLHLIMAILGWSFFVILACAWCGSCLRKRFCKPGEDGKRQVAWQQSTDSINSSDTCEKQSLLDQNKRVDQLTKENNDLRSKLREAVAQRRDKPVVVTQHDRPTINSSTPAKVQPPASRNRTQSTGPNPAVQRQSSNPGPSRLIQTAHHRNTSSPDLYSSHGAAAASSRPQRSMSDTAARPPPILQRSPRRLSFGGPQPSVPPVPTFNPYGPLDNLNEESDG